MFSLPPVNHLANGRSHSRVVWNGSNQSTRSRARRAQKPSKSASASAYRSAVAFAWAEKAGSGGKVRLSARRFSISIEEGVGSTVTGPSSGRGWLAILASRRAGHRPATMAAAATRRPRLAGATSTALETGDPRWVTQRTLFVLGFPEASQARAALAEIGNLGNSGFLKAADWAIVERDADRQGDLRREPERRIRAPHVVRWPAAWPVPSSCCSGRSAGPGGRGLAGAGAVASKLHDSGFKANDMDAVGGLMRDGRTVLLVSVADEYVDNMRAAMKDVPEFLASDRSMESPVTGDAGDVLRNAVEEYRTSHPEG